MVRHALFSLLVCCGAVAVPVVVTAAERFTLVIPGQPAGASQAILDGRGLVVVDPTGKPFTYVRAAEADRDDGQALGYYSQAAGQYLQWPRSGTGNMTIGTMEAGTIRWRTSKMQIQPAVAAAGPNLPVERGRPLGLLPEPDGAIPLVPETGLLPENVLVPGNVRGPRDFLGGPGNPLTDVPQPSRGRLAVPVNLASANALGMWQEAADRWQLAQVDGAGKLHYYTGAKDKWQHQQANLPQRLVAGAPVLVTPDVSSRVPRIHTVDAQGKLLEIRSGNRIRELSLPDQTSLVPRTTLTSLPGALDERAYSVDSRGRMWQLDLQKGRHQPVDATVGRFVPGSPISLAVDQANELYATTARGQLLRYRQQGERWSQTQIAEGLQPGGAVAVRTANRLNGNGRLLAAVDPQGRPQLFQESGETWDSRTLPLGPFVPGGQLALVNRGSQLGLSGIAADGKWQYWDANNRWQSRVIATQFAGGAPIQFDPNGEFGFGMNALGQPFACNWTGFDWACQPMLPPQTFWPTLVRRQVVAGGPLAAVPVVFENRHTEDLAVRLINRVTGLNQDLRIAAGQSVAVSLERDPGGLIEEVWLVPGPLGQPVEEVTQFPIPPQVLYDAVVYADRVTYQYIDRLKQPGGLPSFDLKSLVSLGAFPLPPGSAVTADMTFDIYNLALAQRNPGVAAVLDPAAPGLLGR